MTGHGQPDPTVVSLLDALIELRTEEAATLIALENATRPTMRRFVAYIQALDARYRREPKDKASLAKVFYRQFLTNAGEDDLTEFSLRDYDISLNSPRGSFIWSCPERGETLLVPKEYVMDPDEWESWFQDEIEQCYAELNSQDR